MDVWGFSQVGLMVVIWFPDNTAGIVTRCLGFQDGLIDWFETCRVNDCVIWFPDNTAGIVTKRVGLQRRVQEYYVIPVVVEDNGYPAQSSTGTLTVRVCACVTDGSLLSCTAEAVFLPMGLSTWAVMAILLCMVILLGKSCLSFRLQSWCTSRVFLNFSSDTLRMRVIMITPSINFQLQYRLCKCK